jgi:hypothetical protein
MNEINLEKFTEFGTIKNIYSLYDRKGLIEFVNNVVINMDIFDDNNKNGFGIMLSDLSNIYVLISKTLFPFNKLNSKQKVTIDLKNATNNFVIGYIWLSPRKIQNKENNTLQFINFIDSRISGLNIAKYMIEKYEKNCKYKSCLLPFEVSMRAKKYWKKYFIKVYNIKNNKELDQMINDYKFKETDIRWDELKSSFLNI